MIDPITQSISTIGGNGAWSGGGCERDDISATNACLNNPTSIAIDFSENIYIAELSNYRIRLIDHTTGSIRTVIGNGTGVIEVQ
jgi:trimeric autotransporter adhesin